MARSRRHTPIFGISSSDSEKQSKREANRRLRRITRQRVALGDEVLPGLREVSNVWAFDKDGKRYCAAVASCELRK